MSLIFGLHKTASVSHSTIIMSLCMATLVYKKLLGKESYTNGISG